MGNTKDLPRSYLKEEHSRKRGQLENALEAEYAWHVLQTPRKLSSWRGMSEKRGWRWETFREELGIM